MPVPALIPCRGIRVLTRAQKVAEDPKVVEDVAVVEKVESHSLMQRLRKSLPFWEKIAPPKVLQWIRHGLGPDWTTPPLCLPTHPPPQVTSQVVLAQRILQEYRAEAGAV